MSGLGGLGLDRVWTKIADLFGSRSFIQFMLIMGAALNSLHLNPWHTRKT